MTRLPLLPKLDRVVSWLHTGILRLTVLLALISGLAGPLGSRATTLVVTNLANSGSGTLRAALTNAQDGDVITFTVTGTITNTTTYLTITNNVSIVGPGVDVLAITGTNRYRAFYLTNGVSVCISGLTFVDCYGGSGMDGGAIYNGGNLTLSNCVFTRCRSTFGSLTGADGGVGFAAGNGGAIFNSGTLAAVNCQFLTNAASPGGYGRPGNINPITYGGNGGAGGHGGAVYDSGTARFTNCTFAGNSSGAGGNGGVGGSGALLVTHGPLSPGPGYPGGAGGAGGNGGAVFSSGKAKFVSCTFYNNTTGTGGNGGNGGDGYYHNFYPGGPGGAAGNAGSGALYCLGACQVVACTFVNNAAGSGGSGGNGGNGGSTAIAQTTGASGGNGGNAGNGGSGGGIYGPVTNAAGFTLQNVLIAQNAAGYAGYAGSGGAGAPGVIYGANGLPGTNALDGTGPDLAGKFISQGHNLVGLRIGSTGFVDSVAGDIVGTSTPIDAMVAELTDNHGSVRTCALLIGSPALEAGDDTLLAANVTKDARGYARKSGAHVDIGAYEYQLAVMPVAYQTAVTGDGVQFSFNSTPDALFTVLGSTDLTLPVSSWDVLGQVIEIAPGQFQWTDPNFANYDFRFFSLRSP